MEAKERAAREEALRQGRPPHPGVQTSDTLSSTEFDRFLSERATTGPESTSLVPNANSGTQFPSHPPARQMTNVISGEHQKTEDAMFGL